jgi:LPS O-antigen subunit length determinant protein (WzzB/FepE family)
MKLDNYTQNAAIEGPFKPTRPTKADIVLFWLSGFVAGFIFALLVTGN